MWPFRRNPKEVEVGDVVLAVKRGGLDAARAIYATNASDPRLLCALADALGDLHDIRYLNGESPADPLFAVVADALLAAELGGASRWPPPDVIPVSLMDHSAPGPGADRRASTGHHLSPATSGLRATRGR